MRQYFVLFSALSLFLSACGSVEVSIVTPPPATATEPVAAGSVLVDDAAEAEGEPEAVAAPRWDALGELYFFTTTVNPTTGIAGLPYQLVRLPGSCIVGLAECPQLEPVITPFRWHTSADALSWSTNGNFAALAYPDDPMVQSRIWLFDPAAGSWTSLFELPYIDSPSWSPDGNWILFYGIDEQEAQSVYAIQRDGSGLKTLLDLSSLPDQGTPYVLDGWIGGNIVLRPDWVDAGVQATRYLVSLADGQVQPMPETLAVKEQFKFSNDGAWLAYDEYNYESMEHTFFVAQADGANPRELGRFVTDTDWFPFVWSPDSNRLAFVQDDRGPGKGATLHVNVINRDGTELREVSRPRDTAGGMMFSPDGRFLLVNTSVQTGRRLLVVNLETLEQHILQDPGLSLEIDGFMPSWRK